MGVYPGYAKGRGESKGRGEPEGGAAGYVLRGLVDWLPPFPGMAQYLGFQNRSWVWEAALHARKTTDRLVQISSPSERQWMAELKEHRKIKVILREICRVFHQRLCFLICSLHSSCRRSHR